MTTKILRVHLHYDVPAPTTSERFKPTRRVLDQNDVGERGFMPSEHGISYGFKQQRILIPWTGVKFCELEVPKKKKSKAPSPPKEPPASTSSEEKPQSSGEAA